MQGDPRLGGSGKGTGPDAGDLAGVGLGFAASILLFFFLGRWLDSRLGTEPWLLILGVFIGLSAGFWSMYRRLVVEPRSKQRNEKDERKP
jgi:ATP synthase protein I